MSGSTFGICVPSSCSEEEVDEVILKNLTYSTWSEAYFNGFGLLDCYAEDVKEDLNAGDVAYMCVWFTPPRSSRYGVPSLPRKLNGLSC